MTQPSSLGREKTTSQDENKKNNIATEKTSMKSAPSSSSSSSPKLIMPSFSNLPQLVSSDIKQITEHDPAFTTPLDLLFYPGLWALMLYRFAHVLYVRFHLKFIGKLICFLARMLTGVEIHPAAQISHSCFIDHGHGVVIGETAIVGHNCTLFHGVTLGGTGKEFGKRHPTLGNFVKIGAGAKVLGNIFVGDGSKIGAGSVVVKDVPENSTVVGIPGRCISNSKKLHTNDPVHVSASDKVPLLASDEVNNTASAPAITEKKRAVHMPDIDAEAIRALYRREVRLETELKLMAHRLRILEERATGEKPLVEPSMATSPVVPSELATVYERTHDDESLDLLVKQSQVELLDGAGI